MSDDDLREAEEYAMHGVCAHCGRDDYEHAFDCEFYEPHDEPYPRSFEEIKEGASNE